MRWFVRSLGFIMNLSLKEVLKHPGHHPVGFHWVCLSEHLEEVAGNPCFFQCFTFICLGCEDGDLFQTAADQDDQVPMDHCGDHCGDPLILLMIPSGNLTYNYGKSPFSW